MKLSASIRYAMAFCLAVCLHSVWLADRSPADQPDAFQIVVMDPLAAPLSCPCVEGYAQRKYEVLGKYLQKKLGRDVKVAFGESLPKVLKETSGRADLIIGKDSVVRADASTAGLSVSAVASLTDKTGSTTQHGLFVVRNGDEARRPEDLKGYEVFFGPAECQEKHAAAMELLRSVGVPTPETPIIDQACSDGACRVIELGKKKRVAAVISSYAAPLLEGCGTIKKGDLRVVGKTKPRPVYYGLREPRSFRR